MCGYEFKDTKNITHFLLYIPISIISVVLHDEQLYRTRTSANDGVFL